MDKRIKLLAIPSNDFSSNFLLKFDDKGVICTVYSIIYINGDTSMKRYNIKGVGGGDLGRGQ